MAHVLSVMMIGCLPFSTTLVQVCAILSIILALCSIDYRERLFQVFKTTEVMVVMIFFGLYCLGGFYSVAPLEDILKLIKKMSKLLWFPLFIPLFQAVQWRKRALVVFLVLVIFTGFYAVVTHDLYPFKDSIITSLIMSVGGFMVFRTCLVETHGMKKIAWLVCFCLFFVFACFYTVGRSGFLMFCLLCFVALLQTRGVRSVVTVSLIFGGVLCVAYQSSSMLQARLQDSVRDFSRFHVALTQSNLDKSSVGTRLSFLQNSYEVFQKKPWIGHGTGSFKTVYTQHAQEKQLSAATNPHNEYLNVLVQLGFVGLVGFVSMLFFLFHNATIVLSGFEKHLAQGMVVMMGVGAFLNSWLMDFVPGYLFVLFLAISFGGRNNIRDKG
jgi:O-antigen ligase